jgi:hypothetical protein
MKSGGGKAKGSGYEREVAKFLTKWISGQEKPYIFWRSPSSGALQTISSAIDASGDIIAIRDEGKFLTNTFSIEIKNGYPKADFFQHFKDIKGDIIKDFWLQCCLDAGKAEKYPILIFKKSGLKPIIGINNTTRKELSDYVNLPKSLIITYDDDTLTINFYDMNDFFNIITPGIIKNIKLIL